MGFPVSLNPLPRTLARLGRLPRIVPACTVCLVGMVFFNATRAACHAWKSGLLGRAGG